jgi:hypothetical protein
MPQKKNSKPQKKNSKRSMGQSHARSELAESGPASEGRFVRDGTPRCDGRRF